MSAFKIFVNELYYESFYTTSMENIKNYKYIYIEIFFYHKKFLKIFPKLIFLGHPLTFFHPLNLRKILDFFFCFYLLLLAKWQIY